MSTPTPQGISRLLLAESHITCRWDVPVPGDDYAEPCEQMSRFVVRRSDGDKSFGWDGEHESCGRHLGEVVASMVDGDPRVQAVVTIRWDGAGEDSQ